MKSSIEVLGDIQTIKVVHEGKCDIAELEEVRRKASRLLQETGYKRLLIDATQAEFDVMVTEHNMFLMSHQDFFDTDLRIAAVIDPEVTHLLLQFAPESFAKNIGLSFQVFSELAAAKKWLLEGNA